MKNIILIITLWFCALSIANGQAFVQLSNATGYEYSDSEVDSLEVEVLSILEALNDTTISNHFKVFHVGYYLYNSSMVDDSKVFWDKTLNEVSSLNNYYLLIGTEVNEYGMSKFRFDINLPSQIFSVNNCFTREYLEIVISALNNKYTDIKVNEVFLALKQSIDYIGYKIYNNMNCCSTNRDPLESCSWCKYDMDEVAYQLEQDGYFDFQNLLEIFNPNVNFEVEIKDSTYSNINSEVDIEYSSNTKKYNLTKMVEAFKLNHVPNGVVNVINYDNDPLTSNECFADANVINRNSSSYIENIIVVNYDGSVKAFVKVDFDLTQCEPINLYYFNSVLEDSNRFGYDNRCTDNNIEFARSRMEQIWNFNGYPGLFSFNKVESKVEKDNLELDNIMIFFNFISRNPNISFSWPAGNTAFIPHNSGICSKDFENNGYDSETVCYNNFGGFNKNDLCGPGRGFAHEVAHVLTIRGSFLMNGKPYGEHLNGYSLNLQNSGSSGGHFDWEPNLLSHGKNSPQFASCGSTFNDYDKLNHEAIYLITKYFVAYQVN